MSEPDLAAEQEVDLGRYWRAIAERWWLLVACLVAGLVIGLLVSLGTRTTTYKATVELYLGQPFAPGGAEPVVSAPTNLGLISSFVTSESTIRRVALKAGLKPSRLRYHIHPEAILGLTGAKVGTPAPLLAITVKGSPPAKIVKAANELARLVIEKLSAYTDVKLKTIEEQIALSEKELADLERRIDETVSRQELILSQQGVSGTDKLIASVNFNNVLMFLDQRRIGLEREQINRRLQVSLTKDVERARVTTPPVATKTTGTSSRVGAAIGGLIGLIAGILAALSWEPVAARARRREAG